MADLPDPRSIEILADVLEKTSGTVDGLNVKRYRIKYSDDLNRIDSLTNGHLLKLDRKHKTFRVGNMGLLFIQNETSKEALIN